MRDARRARPAQGSALRRRERTSQAHRRRPGYGRAVVRRAVLRQGHGRAACARHSAFADHEHGRHLRRPALPRARDDRRRAVGDRAPAAARRHAEALAHARPHHARRSGARPPHRRGAQGRPTRQTGRWPGSRASGSLDQIRRAAVVQEEESRPQTPQRRRSELVPAPRSPCAMSSCTSRADCSARSITASATRCSHCYGAHPPAFLRREGSDAGLAEMRELADSGRK